MRPIEWLSDKEFSVAGVRFHCALDDYSLRSSEERFVILKGREDLAHYARLFAKEQPRNVLEFGVFQGGSPALFSLWLELDKFVGIDICAPVAAFDSFCKRHAVGERIRTYYGVSQTERSKVDEIVRREFAQASPDMIIDDASHAYSATRRTFEIAFPHLSPGGLYVIEDWGWAHWPGSRLFIGETPLSVLVMELAMVCASRPDLVSEVRIFPSFAFIRKAAQAPDVVDLRLDDLYQKRDLEIVGARHLNLRGVANLSLGRLTHGIRRSIQRLHRRIADAARESRR